MNPFKSNPKRDTHIYTSFIKVGDDLYENQISCHTLDSSDGLMILPQSPGHKEGNYYGRISYTTYICETIVVCPGLMGAGAPPPPIPATSPFNP